MNSKKMSIQDCIAGVIKLGRKLEETRKPDEYDDFIMFLDRLGGDEGKENA